MTKNAAPDARRSVPPTFLASHTAVRVILVNMKLRGCGTALVTPFRRDGAIAEPALRSLVEWQITRGVHFLVPSGTTGAQPTPTREERLRVIDITLDVADGRVSIVAGATSTATAA